MDNHDKPSTKELQTKMQMAPSASKQVTIVRRGKRVPVVANAGKYLPLHKKTRGKMSLMFCGRKRA